MLTKVLEVREALILFYKRFESYLLPLLKFITMLLVITRLNQALGYAAVLNRGIVNLALAIILTVLPGIWMLLLLGLIIITHLAFVSIETALLIGILLIVVFLVYIQLAPKMSYFILAIPLLFSFNLPYVVPIFAGMFLSPLTIIPITIGTMIYYFSHAIESLIKMQSADWADMPTTIMNMYKHLINTVFSNREMLFTIIVFAVIVVVTYLLTRLTIDYIWYITIASISVINIVLFIVGKLIFDFRMSIFGIIFSTIISALIVALIQFFKCVVDYNRTEKVQYEDEDYYYYVKAVPKIYIGKPQKQIKRIK